MLDGDPDDISNIIVLNGDLDDISNIIVLNGDPDDINNIITNTVTTAVERSID